MLKAVHNLGQCNSYGKHNHNYQEFQLEYLHLDKLDHYDLFSMLQQAHSLVHTNHLYKCNHNQDNYWM